MHITTIAGPARPRHHARHWLVPAAGAVAVVAAATSGLAIARSDDDGGRRDVVVQAPATGVTEFDGAYTQAQLVGGLGDFVALAFGATEAASGPGTGSATTQRPAGPEPEGGTPAIEFADLHSGAGDPYRGPK